MLIELLVRNLGVIPDLALTFGEGMTAVTGETGAGKTLVVEAIDLLLGGRAETSLVAAGATEARVDGRFVRGKGDDAIETVLTRVIPRDGRSRAYVNGHPAPVTQLVEEGSRFVDLHGQHGHQSLLRVGEQRAALDAFGGISLDSLHETREQLRTLITERNQLGGDERARVREIDLLRFQVEELAAADLQDPFEDKTLEQEEDVLADALAHRSAAATAVEALSEDGGARDVVATALAAIANRSPYTALALRLRALSAELGDIAGELRGAGESIDDDPARLGVVRARRQRLQELRRKYGEDLAAVMAYSTEVAQRLDDLVRHDHRAAIIDSQIDQARAKVLAAGAKVVAARAVVAPGLSAAITKRLAELAMPKALFGIAVGPIGEDGDGEVQFLLAANPGAPQNPLPKVASGGESGSQRFHKIMKHKIRGESSQPGRVARASAPPVSTVSDHRAAHSPRRGRERNDFRSTAGREPLRQVPREAQREPPAGCQPAGQPPAPASSGTPPASAPPASRVAVLPCPPR